MFLNALCKASVTLISKSNKNITKKLKANITDDHRCKNPQQNINNLNSTIY